MPGIYSCARQLQTMYTIAVLQALQAPQFATLVFIVVFPTPGAPIHVAISAKQRCVFATVAGHTP